MSGIPIQEGQVRKVRFICFAITAALMIGLWANLPYLLAEHRRLEPWKIALLLIGDITGLVWFLRFVFAHAILGRSLAPAPPINERTSLRRVALGVGIVMLIDLTFTFYLMHDECVSYAQGQVTQATVFAIQEHKRPAATGYELDCSFKDQAGVTHRAHLRVLAAHHELPAALPEEVAQVLNARMKGPNLIHIRYDPRVPERAWIDGLGWEDENGLYWVSLGVFCLQAVATAVFLLLLRGLPNKTWPWWWDIYQVLPLAAETFCMLMMGFIDRLMDFIA